MQTPPYTTQLQAGLGLIDETRSLLSAWKPGMSASELNKRALDDGLIPNVSARRVQNVVTECFRPRYLVDDGAPAKHIKTLQPTATPSEFRQLIFVYTCRANAVLADFVREVYWERYSGGYDRISKDDARAYVERAIDDGKTSKRWSDTTIARVSSYLLGACGDFELLGPMRQGARAITPINLERKVLVYLAYELHFAGLGDNAVLHHEDWGLFGMEWIDIRNEMQRVAGDGHWIVQSAGEVTHITWLYKTMQETLDVLAQA